jgi:hypothetical protein
MKTVLELDDSLSDVALLLQEQRYDEALSVLGDLMEKHPADRETQMYRLLVARILVLRHSLSPTTASAESLPVNTTSADRGLGFHKLARSFLRFSRQPQASPADRLSDLQPKPAESTREADQLSIKNNELLAEISSLTSKLAANERTVGELQAMQNDTQSENQQLHTANQQLQQEMANTKTQLERSESQLRESARHTQELAERNSKMQNEVVELNQLLEVRLKTIADLENKQQRLVETLSDNQKLHSQNQQLQQEIVNLRNELQTIESRLSESARRNQQVADAYARLQIELAEVRQELEASQTNTRALEAVQHRLAEVQSREIVHRENQQKLEAQVAELHRELSSRQESIEELDATRRRLGEAEHLCGELREDNRRLEEEVLSWQELPRERDEIQRRASAPTLQLEELREGAQLADPAAIVPVAKEEDTRPAVWNSKRRRSRLETIPATAVIVITAAVALGFLSTTSRKFTDPKEPGVTLQTVSREESAGSRTDFEPRADFERPKQPAPQGMTGLGKTVISKERPGIKPEARVRGMFKTTRQTEVFNGPSEDAALVASIRPGTKITVVDARNGWLEIRSKTGRPPGFVRQDAAVRVDEN